MRLADIRIGKTIALAFATTIFGAVLMGFCGRADIHAADHMDKVARQDAAMPETSEAARHPAGERTRLTGRFDVATIASTKRSVVSMRRGALPARPAAGPRAAQTQSDEREEF